MVSRETDSDSRGFTVRTAGELASTAPGIADDLDAPRPGRRAQLPCARAADSAASASACDPGDGGGQPEGRGRQDHHHGEHRSRVGADRPAGARDRPRPAGQRVHGSQRGASAGHPVDLRRARRRQAPRGGRRAVAGPAGSRRGAGHHRPRGGGDRAGQCRGPGEQAGPGAAGRSQDRHGRGSRPEPLRLRPHRLPALAGSAHAERVGGRRGDADPDPGGVLRPRGARASCSRPWRWCVSTSTRGSSCPRSS